MCRLVDYVSTKRGASVYLIDANRSNGRIADEKLKRVLVARSQPALNV